MQCPARGRPTRNMIVASYNSCWISQSYPARNTGMRSSTKLRESARVLLHSSNAPLFLAGLALVMTLPSLGLGLQLDDRTYLRLFAEGRGPLDLLHEDAPALAHAKQLGVFAWWSGTDFTIHFLRPITAFSHWLEFRLWPDAPWLMHLSNCLVYAVLVAVVALLYREIFPAGSKLAGLAALMFTINDSHAQTVGWIASRHVVLACTFAMLAVLLHMRGRAGSSVPLQLASGGATAIALLSAEFGFAAIAYIVAYAIVFESGSWRAKLASTWPHALVGAVWLGVYFALGCGVRDAAWYRDPLTAPFELLVQGVADLPMWLVSLFVGDVASAALVLPQRTARLLALAVLVPVLMLLLPPLASSKQARFFAAGTLLSCVLLFATVPQDRMLMATCFGGFGWLACFLDRAALHASGLVRAGSNALRVPHLVIAPIAFVPMLGGVSAVDGAAQALAQAVSEAGTTQAIAVNLPIELLTNAAFSVRNGSGVPLHQLYAGFAELDATRPDARTLELSSEAGWGTRPIERMFAKAHSMPKLGETRQVSGMRATVVELSPAGLPSRVRFEFPDPLESHGRVWLVWDGHRPKRWDPPPVGAQAKVPSASMLTLLY